MPDDVKLDIKTNEPKVTHYKVAGATLKEALKQLQKKDEWGTYDSTQNQKSGAKIDADGKVKSVTLTLNPTIELPEWGGYGKATKAQKKAWDDMVAKLEKHERNHHKIQKDALEDLKKKIKAAKSLDQDALEDLLAKNSDAAQKQQDAYDSRSGHGKKEGVELDTDADEDNEN